MSEEKLECSLAIPSVYLSVHLLEHEKDVRMAPMLVVMWERNLELKLDEM